MKKVGSVLLKFSAFCLVYVIAVNVIAAYVNDSIDTLTVIEATSVNGMKTGQRDILVFLEQKLEEVDVEELRQDIMDELNSY
jgi:hypothetical protein